MYRVVPGSCKPGDTQSQVVSCFADLSTTDAWYAVGTTFHATERYRVERAIQEAGAYITEQADAKIQHNHRIQSMYIRMHRVLSESAPLSDELRRLDQDNAEKQAAITSAKESIDSANRRHFEALRIIKERLDYFETLEQRSRDEVAAQAAELVRLEGLLAEAEEREAAQERDKKAQEEWVENAVLNVFKTQLEAAAAADSTD